VAAAAVLVAVLGALLVPTVAAARAGSDRPGAQPAAVTTGHTSIVWSAPVAKRSPAPLLRPVTPGLTVGERAGVGDALISLSGVPRLACPLCELRSGASGRSPPLATSS
jgi:hypothetical protein